MLRTRLSAVGVGLSLAAFHAAPAEAKSFNPFTSTPKIVLHYFPIQGPAEPARLALVLGGIPFEDVRHNREEMLKMRADGELPYGQLPIMTVDGKMLAQSGAIANWCAKLAGLVPKDSFVAAKVEEVCARPSEPLH